MRGMQFPRLCKGTSLFLDKRKQKLSPYWLDCVESNWIILNVMTDADNSGICSEVGVTVCKFIYRGTKHTATAPMSVLVYVGPPYVTVHVK